MTETFRDDNLRQKIHVLEEKAAFLEREVVRMNHDRLLLVVEKHALAEKLRVMKDQLIKSIQDA